MPTQTAEFTEPSKVAVLIPCYQEEKTIAKVVQDFRRELPDADIYVYDNNCTDRTAQLAAEAGAVVRREKKQGKGFVVASMFEQVDADIYLMVDGDDTYDAGDARRLIAPILGGDADMTVAGRQTVFEKTSFPQLHQFGNRLVCWLINRLFGSNIRDVFSGYRAFTRETALNIPLTAHGFDVETEMTLQALYRGMVVIEFESAYGTRPEGSFSKLRTFSDGFKVLLRLFIICKSYKPLAFFGSGALVLFFLSLVAGARPIYEYFSHAHVYAVPSALLAASLAVAAFLSLALGLILNSVNMRLLELERLVVKRMTKISSETKNG
jgi:glycosyltransferase involved in cell wall biosynthesis